MPSKRRPGPVTWLSLGVLIFAGIQITRLAAGLRLPDLPFHVPEWYVPLTAALWAGIALATAGGLFTGSTWAPTSACWSGLAYAVWYWADRLWFGQTDYTRRTWPFALTITILCLTVIFVILNLQSVKRFYRENTHE